MRHLWIFVGLPVLALLTVAVIAWLRVLAGVHDTDEPADQPEHVGADETWSPTAEFGEAKIAVPADWDEGAQLRERLDHLQDWLHKALTEVEFSALTALADACGDDEITHDRVLLAAVAE